jgi:Brp/Blh family beta-carotene 15,15'-monooxygenase
MDLVSGLLDLGVWNLIGLAGIVLIGLPHGALDGAVAMHLGLVDKFSTMARFVIIYVGLAGLVVGAWIIAPSLSLIVFLTISMLHFGAGDARHGEGILRFAETLAHGGLAIVGISQFHRSEADEIFYYLINQDTAMVWLAINVLTVAVIVAIIACVSQAAKDVKWSATTLELLILGIVYALVPPLLGFAIYFCLVHSARHFKRILSTIKATVDFSNIKNQVILFTTASWIAAGIAFWMFADFADPGPTVLRITFIGLAALTVPHMLLIDGVMKSKQVNESVTPQL